MAISYPLDFPTITGVDSIKMMASDIVGMNISPFSGAQQVYRYTGQFWSADIALPPMKREKAEYWISFFLKLNGSYGTFLMGDPLGATARGVATGTPVINGASQTGGSLVTDGWTPGTTGILKAGDYIQLGAGATSRLHKVLDDVDSDGSGNATLQIWPDLRESPSDNATITVTNAKGVFRLTSTQAAFDINRMGIYGVTFGAQEAL
jgi:hypothetical protein